MAEGGGIDIQKVRIKSGKESCVFVYGEEMCYLAVVFYKDGLYHFAIESRQLPRQGAFSINDDHIESEIPFKTSTEEPNYGSMMEFGSAGVGSGVGAVH